MISDKIVRESVLKTIAFYCLLDIQKAFKMNYKDDVLEWTESTRLFQFFAWFLTVEASNNGLNLFKGEGKINTDLFLKLVKPINIDTGIYVEFRAGKEPKGSEKIKKIVLTHLYFLKYNKKEVSK